MNKAHKELLRKHAKHFATMSEFVRASSSDDLIKLAEACNAMTDTNCGWDMFAAAKFLLREIGAETGMRQRRAADQPAKVASPPPS